MLRIQSRLSEILQLQFWFHHNPASYKKGVIGYIVFDQKHIINCIFYCKKYVFDGLAPNWNTFVYRGCLGRDATENQPFYLQFKEHFVAEEWMGRRGPDYPQIQG